MVQDNRCPLSGHKSEAKSLHNALGRRISCPACGTYDISDGANVKGREYILSGIARRRSDEGRLITISTENVDDLLSSVVPPRDPQEVVDLILEHIAAKVRTFPEDVTFDPEKDYPLAFARDDREMNYCITLGVDSGYLKKNAYELRLTAKGWQRFNALRDVQTDSAQAFVAMSFDAALDPIWKQGFRPALKQTGLDPLRIDQKEFNEKIDDQIIAEIRRSGLVVADFTGHRGGVYFEAGFAMGLGIPVIWTCKKDDIENAHFDTRQYNHIVWQDAEDLKTKLVNRIEATILGRVSTASSLGNILSA